MSDFNALMIGLEFKPAYDTKNPMATALFRAVNETCEYVKSTAELVDGKVKPITRERSLKLLMYMRTTLGPLIDKILNQHYKVKNVTTIEDHGPNVEACMFFSTDRTRFHETEAYLDRARGTHSDAKFASDIFDKARLEIDSKSTGELGEIGARVMKSRLIISSSLFFLNEIYSNFSLTARQITAIILHEIGHMITLLSFIGQWHFIASDIQDSVTYIKNNANPDKVPEIVESTLKEIAQLPVNPATTAAAKFMNQVREVSKTDSFLRMPAQILKCIISPIIFIVAVIAQMMWANKLLAPFMLGSQQQSETIVTQRNYSLTERSADSFATAMGYGGDLAQALATIISLPIAGKMRGGALGNSTALITMVEWIRYIGIVACPIDIFPYMTPYDNNIRRLEMIINNSVPGLKDPNTPKEVRDVYIEAVDNAKKALAEYKGQTWYKVNTFIFDKLLGAYSPRSVLGMVVNGNVSADYDFLQDVTKELMNSGAYVQASKLSNLIDKP